MWLKKLFEGYYRGVREIPEPEAIHQREFGFGSFSKKINIRHRAFKSSRELLDYIKEEAPAHINYSTARYEFPAGSMEEKGWLGTDLVFDIDVGDLHLNHKHSEDWLCEICFEELKKETQKLLDFLMNDFGFSRKELLVNFSGSRGYHVRIEDKRVLELDERARREICSYLGAEASIKDMITERDGMIFGPKPSQGGLKGRIARKVIEEIRKSKIEDRERIAMEIEKGNWGAFPRGYGIGRIREVAENTGVRIPVDSKVTTDTTHMIRLPETLHGGSSLLARVVGNLDQFDPMRECFVFDGEETSVRFLREIPNIVAMGEEFGPFTADKTEIPRFLAAYMAAHGWCVVEE